MSAALDGYKVLVIDLDSQGSMTSIFGGTVEDEWQTAFPLLARHYGEHLRADNQRRLDRGEAPQPLDEALSAAMEMTARDVIQPTHWPNIDLIGAQLNLYWAEFQVPVWRMACAAGRFGMRCRTRWSTTASLTNTTSSFSILRRRSAT